MTVAPSDRNQAIGALMTVVGGLIAIAGTLLPWEQINAGVVDSNRAGAAMGIEWDDGKIFIFFAILTIVASGCWLASARLPVAVVTPVGRLLGNGSSLSALTGGYVVVFGFLNLRDIAAQVDRLNAGAGGIASVGAGIYVDLVAGGVILAGAAVGLLAARSGFRAGDPNA
jgi:hypothetical protein